MLFQIKTINGQKTIVPLTADTGAGNPVGTIIVVCSNQIPSNYLPLGTQYNTTLYPILYALLGTDTTPTASALGLPTLSSGQYAIKATSGLSENAQDNVINTLNEQRSYSTEEHLTGKKWIDGKDIYSKTIVIDYPTNSIDVTSLRISTIVSINGFFKNNIQWIIPIGFNDGSNNANVYWNLDNTTLTIITTATGQRIINIEYTKTTD